MAIAKRGQTPGHLPKHDGGKRASSSEPPPGLPRQRRGTTPQMHGRYPDYDVLAGASHWDEVTRGLVLARVGEPPPIRCFDAAQARTLGAFCDVVTAQHSEPRIPVLAMVDAKLYEGKLDGFRYHDMPSDQETWRRVAANLDASAQDQTGGEEGFAEASSEVKHEIVRRFARGELDWDLPVSRAWEVVMRMVLAAFYSHPWAWNEIGFGGPAYPRGFARIGPGQREHWEAPPRFSLDPVADVHERGLE